MIVAIVVTVSLTPALPRKRARGTKGRCATFKLTWPTDDAPQGFFLCQSVKWLPTLSPSESRNVTVL
jgi:hypothetical protein